MLGPVTGGLVVEASGGRSCGEEELTNPNRYGERGRELHERYRDDQSWEDLPLSDLVNPPCIEPLDPCGD